MKIHY